MEGQIKSDTVYFPHLDVIRFMAAMFIVILHAYEGWTSWFGEVGFLSNGTYTDLSQSGKYVDQLIKNLGIGVDIFFLISGFLITYLLLEERKRMGNIHIGFFMIRRSLRIWPLYFLLIAISPFLVNWTESNDPNYIANALFVGNFATMNSHQWAYPFSHFWSICIEEHFYLVWPFIIAFIPFKKMMYVFLGIITFSIGFRMYTVIGNDAPWYTLFLHTVSRIDVLVLGAIGGYYYSQKPFDFKLNRIVRVLLLLSLVVYFCWDSYVLWDSPFKAGFGKYIYLIVISILLLDYNFNSSRKRMFKSKSILHYFGKISYGIYMYSNIILLIIIKNVMWPMAWNNMWLFFSLVIGLSLLIPIISYELFEKPILKLAKRFRRVNTDR